MTKWDEFVTAEKAKIDAAKTDTEFSDALRSAMGKFGISHIQIMTPRMATARTERKAVGIGVQIQPQEDGLLIINVFDGSAASEAKLQPGDLIIEAEGVKLTSTSTILGDEGTKVNLKIKRGSDGKIEPMTLTRRKFSNVRPETLTWVNKETALLKIPTFDLSYNRVKVNELMAEARKAKNVILDLRSNGGGAVINMLHLLGYFVPSDKPFGLFVTKSLAGDFVKATNGSPTDLPKLADWAERGWLRSSKPTDGPLTSRVSVLINGGSGSASEITAAALKDLREASVVGTKSAGAVLVSTMAPVGSGWLLQYPLSDYITKAGIRIEGNGIVPDVEAPLVKFGDPDTAIDKALALFRRAELRDQRSGG